MRYLQGQHITFIETPPISSYPEWVKNYDIQNEKRTYRIGPLTPIKGDSGKITKKIQGGWLKVFVERTGLLLTIRNGNHISLSDSFAAIPSSRIICIIQI